MGRPVVPAKLAFYIDVDDLDAYRQKIKQAGGKVIVEWQDVPGVGQFSVFEDPEGGVLGMWKAVAGDGKRCSESSNPGGAEVLR